MAEKWPETTLYRYAAGPVVPPSHPTTERERLNESSSIESSQYFPDSYVGALEAERDQLDKDMERLLEVLQPFCVDLGVGCGYETLERIRETVEELEDGREEKTDG